MLVLITIKKVIPFTREPGNLSTRIIIAWWIAKTTEVAGLIVIQIFGTAVSNIRHIFLHTVEALRISQCKWIMAWSHQQWSWQDLLRFIVWDFLLCWECLWAEIPSSNVSVVNLLSLAAVLEKNYNYQLVQLCENGILALFSHIFFITC